MSPSGYGTCFGSRGSEVRVLSSRKVLECEVQAFCSSLIEDTESTKGDVTNIGLWCNGSTGVFEALSPGSSPGNPVRRGIEQLAARQPHKLKVGGSSPPPAKKLVYFKNTKCPCSSVGQSI